MSGTPYMAGPFALACTGGEKINIEINVPWRAVVKAFKFTNVGGTDANCDVELFTKSEAAPPTGSSESSSGELPFDPAMFSVFGAKTYTAGTPLTEYDKSYPYVNQDSKASNPTRKLYVQLTPSGAGDKVYELALELMTSMLN